MPPPCFQRPWRSISWVGAPFWAMRLAMPTRPLWPLKNSQFSSPAALAMAFTRRAICDSDSPNTFTSPPTPAGRIGGERPHGGGSDGHHRALGLGVGLGADHGDPAASVLPALDVAPGQRGRLGPAQSRVGQHGHQGQVKLPPFCSLIGCLDAAAALAGLDGGEPDDGEHVGGEGAGLALGLRESPSPSLQRGAHARVRQGDSSFAHSWALEMAEVARRRVAMLAPEFGAGGQVAGHGEGLGRQGPEAHLVAPAGEDAPLGPVDPAGVAGEDRLQGVGHAPVGGAQFGRQGRGFNGGRSADLAMVVMGGSPEAGLRGDPGG